MKGDRKKMLIQNNSSRTFLEHFQGETVRVPPNGTFLIPQSICDNEIFLERLTVYRAKISNEIIIIPTDAERLAEKENESAGNDTGTDTESES